MIGCTLDQIENIEEHEESDRKRHFSLFELLYQMLTLQKISNNVLLYKWLMTKDAFY